MPSSMPIVEERVDRLEDSIDRFIISVGIEFNKLYNSQMRTEAELRVFKEEMRQYREETRADTLAFKEEMSEFKDEMSEFKDEMSEFKDEMSEFKDEMSEFKDEMSAYKEENRLQIRTMNRQWGDLANKLGTMVEDLVYPSLARIIHDALGTEAERIWARLKQRLPDGRVKEFDAVALAGDIVCLNSTKSSLRSSDVDSFVKDIHAFSEFFPEYSGKPVIGILATLTVEKSVLNYAEKVGFLVLAIGDEIMEVKNRPGFEPKRW